MRTTELGRSVERQPYLVESRTAEPNETEAALEEAAKSLKASRADLNEALALIAELKSTVERLTRELTCKSVEFLST